MKTKKLNKRYENDSVISKSTLNFLQNNIINRVLQEEHPISDFYFRQTLDADT